MSNIKIKKFLSCFSIETTPSSAAKINHFSEFIPKKTSIYIAHIEGTPIEDMVNTAKKITTEGFIPVPHFPARIIKNKDQLKDWIDKYQSEANVQDALLIAGGIKKPYGDFDSSIQLIETEFFDIAGFQNLYVAGHPEGSIDIDPDGSTTNVDKAISWKQKFSERTDSQIAITTQFCFDASSVIKWVNRLKAMGVDVPIHIGVAGPAKLQTLLRYSIECGVGASLKILQKRAKDITKLLLPYKPTVFLEELAEYKKINPDFNIQKVHFYPLGGIKQIKNFVSEL